VYAVDWLGMGRSARVPFTVKAKREDVSARVEEAESFFVESLEDWRVTMGLEKMTLIGHSLGAYLSVVYALRYPTRVSKLILLSPAGVPRDPNETTVPSREVMDTQKSVNASGEAETATRENVETIKAEQRRAKREESKTRQLFTYLWEEGWSPFQVVRSSLFWGPLLVGKVREAHPHRITCPANGYPVFEPTVCRSGPAGYKGPARLHSQHHTC
jgi:cardiolipin-specific phospholipase